MKWVPKKIQKGHSIVGLGVFDDDQKQWYHLSLRQSLKFEDLMTIFIDRNCQNSH